MERTAPTPRPSIRWSILTVAFAVIACTSAGAPGATWYTNPFNGHKYALTSGPKSWTDAQAEAASHGAHLTTLTTRAEEDWVTVQFAGGELGALYTSGVFWIGLTDIGRAPGDWYWVTGESLIYTHWRSGNPDNLGVEHYVQWFSLSWDNRTNTNQSAPFTGPARNVYGVMELSPPTQIKTPFAVPEPPAASLAAIGLGVLATFAVRCRSRFL